MANNKIMRFPGNIPDDIIFNNILPCLHCKSLGQLKSVCKKWYSEIDQVLRRRSLASGWIFVRHSHLVFVSTLHDPIQIRDPFLDFVSDPIWRICDSSNGLLCLRLEKCLYVCNPVTRRGHRIPYSKNKELVGLIFEPSTSPDQYKLVCAINKEPRRRQNQQGIFRFEVFSSCNKKWVRSDKEVSIPDSGWRQFPKSSSAKGVVYWSWMAELMWFDCVSDRAGYFKFPPGFSSFVGFMGFGTWEDRFSYTKVGPESIYVWVLVDIDDNGGKWDTLYRLSLPPFPSSPFPSFPQPKWVWAWPFRGGEKVFLTEMYRMPNHQQQGYERLLSLELKTGILTELFKGELLGTRNPLAYDNSYLVESPTVRKTVFKKHGVKNILI